MKRIRFSIAGMMAVVLLVAVAIASLTHPTQLLASLINSVTLGVLCLSAIGAAFRGGERRRFWAGFAVFGWVNYLLVFPPESMNMPMPPLPVTLLAFYLMQKVHTGVLLDSAGQAAFYHIAYSLSVILVGFIGAFLSWAVFREDASAQGS